MKVPEPRKLSSGKWFIQLRLGGESVTVSDYSKKECIRQATLIKAEHINGKRAVEDKNDSKLAPTLFEEINRYINDKSNTLSPSTIRGYKKIQKYRFQDLSKRSILEISNMSANELQVVVNEEAALCAPRYLKNAFGLIKSVVKYSTGKTLPDVKLSAIVPSNTAFLLPEEIILFVEAVKGTIYEIPALLALSSMRMSEIQALDWKNIPKNPDFIRTTGATVLNSENKLVTKEQAKNYTSARNVPILIPSLREALERERKPSGPVMEIKQNALRSGVHQICAQNDLTDITIHCLRHSFASLAYHLRIPEKIVMEIGGWSDTGTMHKIYTHIAQRDIKRYQTEMADFYNRGKAENS